MNIPFVDLQKQYRPLKSDILARIERVLDGMHLFLGENMQALEAEFASYSGARYGIAVSDGTTALQLALLSCGIGPGDEVITVSHTFFATAEAIAMIGACPVFVDVDPETCLMDVAQMEAKVTSRTKAIVPVHLYGQMADIQAIHDIAVRHNLKVIADACQAHGAESYGRKTGDLVDAAAFSFYFSKNLGAYGEGGFVATNGEDVAHAARLLRNHGSEERYYHSLVGVNGRLDEIQAAVLRSKLPFLDEWNERRWEHALRYRTSLQGTPVITPVECPGNRHVYHLYVIRAPERDRLQAWLSDRGVSTGIHYPVPCHLQQALAYLGYQKGDLPVTEQIASEILSLPMYAELTDAEIDYVANAVKDFYRETAHYGSRQ